MKMNTAVEESWARLADLDETEREALMESRYRELALLSEDERRRRLADTAEAEYTLPSGKLRLFHHSRLRSWLRLEPGAAGRVAASYNAVMRRLPGDLIRCRVSVVRSLLRSFPQDQRAHLKSLVPRVWGDGPDADAYS